MKLDDPWLSMREAKDTLEQFKERNPHDMEGATLQGDRAI
jgi:hypothetical protein